jgi:hypothetical protein
MQPCPWRCSVFDPVSLLDSSGDQPAKPCGLAGRCLPACLHLLLAFAACFAPCTTLYHPSCLAPCSPAPPAPPLTSQVRANLFTRAKDFGIVLDDIAITHLSFSTEFTKAVEMKQVAAQDAERAKFVVLKAEQVGAAGRGCGGVVCCCILCQWPC